MPKSEQRCSTNMSVSTKESWSSRSSTRSLAVSLPWRTLWYTTAYNVSEYPFLEKYTKKVLLLEHTKFYSLAKFCQQELRVLEHLLKCKRFISYAANANLYPCLFFDTGSLWVNVIDSHRDKHLWIFTALNIRISSENKVRTLVYISFSYGNLNPLKEVTLIKFHCRPLANCWTYPISRKHNLKSILNNKCMLFWSSAVITLLCWASILFWPPATSAAFRFLSILSLTDMWLIE